MAGFGHPRGQAISLKVPKAAVCSLRHKVVLHSQASTDSGAPLFLQGIFSKAVSSRRALLVPGLEETSPGKVLKL